MNFRIKMFLAATYCLSCLSCAVLSAGQGPSLSDILMYGLGLWSTMILSIAIVLLLIADKSSRALNDKFDSMLERIFKV